ncbi:MAG: CBS domain-containing protein [Sphingorhabdus sp.]
MTIAAILEANSHPIHQASGEDSVAEVAAKLAEFRIGALPITEGGEVKGIFSERDLVYGIARSGAAMLEQKVSEAMTAPAITVSADTAVLSALSLMTKRRIRHLPVIDDNGICGFVSIGDLVKYRIEKIEAEANAMRDYIQMA